MFQTGDKVDVWSHGRQTKRIGEVIAILHPGSKNYDRPVVVKHPSFTASMDETIIQVFPQEGCQNASSGAFIERCFEYNYANVFSTGRVGEWYNTPSYGYRGPNFIGQIRATIVDGKITNPDYKAGGW